MAKIVARFFHHFVCNISWSFPYFVDCPYENCGNWKESRSYHGF